MKCEKTDILAKFFPFWDKLSSDEQTLLCDNLSNVSCKKGENLHSGDKNCRGVVLIRKGQLRIYMLSEEGKEITLYRLHSGATCILSVSCALSAITFDVFVDAEEDCELCILGTTAFNRLMDQNIYVEAYAYKLVTQRFSQVMRAMQKILFMSMDRRLATFLLTELSKTGEDKVSMTHEQIAKYIGSAREVVSRTLKNFADDGIVMLSRGGVLVCDIGKLRRLADGK